MTEHIPGFSITDGKGFHIRFENGATVSVQFGYGNYCDNYDMSYEEYRRTQTVPPSTTAEVGAWWDTGPWIDVLPRQTPTQVLAFMSLVASLERPK